MTRRPPQHNNSNQPTPSPTVNENEGNERQTHLRALPSVDELTRAMLAHLTPTATPPAATTTIPAPASVAAPPPQPATPMPTAAQASTAAHTSTSTMTATTTPAPLAQAAAPAPTTVPANATKTPATTEVPPAPASTATAATTAIPATTTPAPASHDALVRAARSALAEARATLTTNAASPITPITTHTLTTRALALLEQARRPALRPVINATGVIINTNLGRAPLSPAALAAIQSVASTYSNLEYDLAHGERGSRQTPVRALLRELTGAQDAIVVNNNAAAVLLILATLATNREVIVSRGELVEIGGGFRIPDVMRQSGARLIEVGTTNRTRVRDFETAITPDTGLLLAVHPSNFRIVGFAEAPDLAALAACAHTHDLPLMHDLGSGCLYDTERWGLAHEPTVRESIAAGVDIVCFSGDKLLGGPQAGIIAGRTRYIEQIERHPLTRALRIDKLTLAALEATLRQHRDGLAEREIPIWRMIATHLDDLHTRATRWAEAIQSWGYHATVTAGHSTVGGGSLPGETLPTHLCALDGATTSGSAATPPRDLEHLATHLRQGTPAVVARVYRDQLLLDPRTVLPGEDELLLQALHTTLTTT